METQLTDMAGHIIIINRHTVQQDQFYTFYETVPGSLPKGVYHLLIIDGKMKRTISLVK
jgi:hypothetical protein